MTLSIKGKILSSNYMQSPFKMIVSGSIGTGKTTFIKKLFSTWIFLKNKCTLIYYYYPRVLQELPIDCNDLSTPIIFRIGLPTIEVIKGFASNSCIIIEDQYEEAMNNHEINDLFSIYARSCNISVILSGQDLYMGGKYSRTIINNCNYFTLFSNYINIYNTRKICRKLGLQNAYKKACQIDAK